ncbi:DUF951 domain-containing protein [Texcoconibacillus texcoconensis]|uniref:DUF951 domain-containing protein n=1 Tax=Texcoconibacillus texcoconensis TaxID=1095777 RepID=A0A840QU00_9BACI|nr:DUF951 domain-containing protein [Texcoconibacillus texcoconensis]MBB5174768.1 hypothetical protein [Texcoconibacillus texcoconensis]
MADQTFDLYDIVKMKKQHPCGENRWQIIRMGMDIRIKCLGCEHSVLMPRREFEKKVKSVIERHESSSNS